MLQKDEGNNSFLIATPEKALLDFFYFRTKSLHLLELDWFEKSCRLQNLENLDMDKLHQLADLFQQKKLTRLVNLFTEWKATL